MRKFLGFAAVAVLAAPAFAQTIQPAVKPNAVKYNLATGAITPQGAGERIGTSVWSSTNTFGFYVNLTFNGVDTIQLLDWADTAATTVGGFQIAYCATDVSADVQTLFYTEENGFDAHARALAGGFNIIGLPAGGVVGGFGCWIVTLDLDFNPNFPFPLAGSDLDVADGQAPNFTGVGLVDFGWTYGLLSPYNNAAGGFGPIITVDVPVYTPTPPGTGTGPGEEDAMDLFEGVQGTWATFNGTYWYGGYDYTNPNTIWGTHWLDLSDSAGGPSCPNPAAGCDNADIFPDGALDCVVNISDLGVVLANYAPGVPGKTRAQGDIFPLGAGMGNGIVDLSDLGQMLTDFNTDCR